jgi:hypothetical protein
MAELLTAVGGASMTALNPRVAEVMAAHNRSGRRPLNPYEAKQLADGEDHPFYIYNVSPIHTWERRAGKQGTRVIPVRKWDEKVSIPVVVKGCTVSWSKQGPGQEQPLLEGGKEVVEDICGSGPLYDSRSSNSDLTRQGLFICEKPFTPEYLPTSRLIRLNKASGTAIQQLRQEFLMPISDQNELIQDATGKLLVHLQDRILEADNYYMGGAEQRKFVQSTGWFRECLKAFNHITGQKVTKPWASIQIDDALVACLFCGNQNKPGLALCPNCHQVINQVLYDQLKKQVSA